MPSDTLQRKNAENLKQIFPEEGISPNIHIHVSVSELYNIYSHDGAAVSAGGNMRTDPGNI